MNTFLKAHLISLKLLIIDIFILPGKIYSKTLCVLAKGDKKKILIFGSYIGLQNAMMQLLDYHILSV